MDPTEELIMVLDCRAAARVITRVRERVETGLCLGTDSKGCECSKPATKLGLCTSCYYAYRTERAKKTTREAAIYEARLIRAGRVLGRNQARVYKSRSIFRKMA